MNVSAPFIHRPIATSLLTIGVLLLGLLAYRLLPIAALPTVEFPTVEVTASLPGASPEVMASSVTTPLEHQLGQIAGLTSMVSTSSFGVMTIALQFTLGRDIDHAAQDVQSAINTASGQLPKTLPAPPTYNKVNPADTPILVLALTSTELPLPRLDDYAETMLAQKLSQVEGVGLVAIEGGQKPAVRIQLNPTAVASLGLGLDDLRTLVAAANVDQPKGNIDGPRQAFFIAADDQLFSAAAYGRVILAYRNGAPIRLADVASVVDGAENDRIAAWASDSAGSQPAIILDIERQPGANIIRTVDSLRALLPKLQAALPPSVKMQILSDRTQTIRASIADVELTLLLTMALVVLVIFVFLRKLWATVIPSVTLPLSLAGTFGIMYLAGFSLDNLSLMALTISTGFVVDDAIVMIENIVRHIEAGEPPRQAALLGARQIGFTVISLTVSLVAVFIPLLFMGGIVGRLFREFAITLSVAVVVSAIISLTLTPVMCAYLLKDGAAPSPAGLGGRLFGWTERGFEALLGLYAGSLRWVLSHQQATLALTLLTLGATLYLYGIVPKGFLPQQDTGVVIGVTEASPDISFAAMSARQRELAEIVQRDPAVASVESFVGTGPVNATGNVGRLAINLRPQRERVTSAEQAVQRLRKAALGVPGITLFLQPAQDLQLDQRISRTQYQYVLQDADIPELQAWTPRLVEALKRRPELRDIGSDQQLGGLQTAIRIDRSEAGRLGVALQTIDDTLYDAFGQRQISTIYTQLSQYHVILEADPVFQADPASLSHIFLKSSTGQQVPLSSLAHVERINAPLSINHQSQFPSVTLSFNLGRNASLGQALDGIAAAEREIGLPEAIVTGFTGSAAQFRDSLSSEGPLILAAIIVVYIVLGVLYESYIHPITILSTLPSAGVGALLALMAAGEDLSIISLIGIILLIGIVKKNAIMMIDFALDAERTRGMAPEHSIFDACMLRFRPIMMTTMAALLGALPLALGHGTGAELRRPMGIAIVGGLALSQFLTLYTTPVIYLALSRIQGRLDRGRRSAARGPRLALVARPDAAE